MKKYFRCAVASVVAGSMLALAGCSTAKKTNSGSDAETVTVSISFWEPSTNKEMETALNEICAKYTELHPNVEFDLRVQPVSGYQDWLKARLAADEAPTIVENHANQLRLLYEEGYISDITEDLNSENPYVDGEIWKDIFQEGRMDVAHEYAYEPTYAIPYSGNGLAFFYNKDLYNELGLDVPQTWSEFIANCEAIQKAGTNPFALMLMKNDTSTWLNWWIMTGLYGNYFLADKDINPNGDKSLHEREIARAVDKGYFSFTEGMGKQAYSDYLDKISELGKYAEGATGLDEAGAKAQFLAGNAAQILSGSWDLKAFSEHEGFDVGVFPIPKFTEDDGEYVGSNFSVTSAQVFGVSKSDKKSQEEIDAAVDFLKFFTAPENYKIYVETTFSIPVINGLDIDPSFEAFIGGNSEPLGLFLKKGQISETNNVTATTLAAGGQSYDKNTVLKGMQDSVEEFVTELETRDGVGPDNDYGINDIAAIGVFEKTAP